VKAYELDTLNAAREENIALKKTSEGLRRQLEGVVRINDGMRAGAAALGKAMRETYGKAAMKSLSIRTNEILQEKYPTEPSAN
jgi:hypothetical protein